MSRAGDGVNLLGRSKESLSRSSHVSQNLVSGSLTPTPNPVTTGDDIHDDGDEEKKWCVRVPSRDKLKGSGTVLQLTYMVYM